jgi:F0F1-type ATP synthase gamma subunit
MRKAQDRMRKARPYGEKIRTVAAHISHANPSTATRSSCSAIR